MFGDNHNCIFTVRGYDCRAFLFMRETRRKERNYNMKKFLSILLSVVMAVTTMSALAVSASAIDLFPDAVTAKSGKEVDITMSKGAKKQYKITVSKKGKLDLKIVHTSDRVEFKLYDAEGGEIEATSCEAKTGTCYTSSCMAYRDSSAGLFSGSFTYNLTKGTYYIQLYNPFGGEASFTPTYPSASSSEKSVSYLSATLKKGSTLQLGAVLSDGKAGTAEWSSSKSSVAAVSSKGKITAKAKGTAVITAKVGSSTVKIQIKVTE